LLGDISRHPEFPYPQSSKSSLFLGAGDKPNIAGYWPSMPNIHYLSKYLEL
jgi:hypothetical protein